MKRSVFFTLAVAFVMLFASCSKEVKLPGTTWTANYSKTITYMGASGNVSLDMTLKFIDETNYTMDVTSSATVMGQTMPAETDNQKGTYTFDGEKGVFDGEQEFTYNKDDETITTVINLEEEEAEMFGTDKITLTFKQK